MNDSKTPMEIMDEVYKKALTIVNRHADNHHEHNGSRAIAASNLALALFSYEVEQEAMRERDLSMPDDDFDLLDDDGDQGEPF